MQSAKVLENNEKLIGVGISMPPDEDEPVFIPEIYGRWAAFANTDMGIKITGIPFALGIIGLDFKYQVLNLDSFYVSLDFGISHSGGDGGSTIGYYPAIFFGTERVFGGAKLIIADFDFEFFGRHKGTSQLPEFFIGASIGDKFRVMPVANLLYSENFKESQFLFSLGLEHRF